MQQETAAVGLHAGKMFAGRRNMRRNRRGRIDRGPKTRYGGDNDAADSGNDQYTENNVQGDQRANAGSFVKISLCHVT